MFNVKEASTHVTSLGKFAAEASDALQAIIEQHDEAINVLHAKTCPVRDCQTCRAKRWFEE